MNTSLVRFAVAACITAPLSALAQSSPAPADRHGDLTLLAGPKLTSFGAATGEVVPGQMWRPITVATIAPTTPFTGTTTFVRGGSFTFRSLSSPPPASHGTLTLGKSPEPMAEARNLRRKPLPLVEPAALHFNTTLPKTEIRPLQKTATPAPATSAPANESKSP